MNQNEILMNMFASLVQQAITNKAQQWKTLPPDQKEALEKMLDAIHTLIENKKKISGEYQKQVFDAMVLQIATETGFGRI